MLPLTLKTIWLGQGHHSVSLKPAPPSLASHLALLSDPFLSASSSPQFDTCWQLWGSYGEANVSVWAGVCELKCVSVCVGYIIKSETVERKKTWHSETAKQAKNTANKRHENQSSCCLALYDKGNGGNRPRTLMCRNRWHISETSGRLSRSLVSLKICGAINFCLVKSAMKHSSRSLSNYYDYRGYTNKSISQLIHFPFHSACHNICILFKLATMILLASTLKCCQPFSNFYLL